MNPYQQILCPVDFSDISRRALVWSIDFAHALGSELTALHVLETALMNVGNLVAIPDGAKELRAAAEKEMASWRKELELTDTSFMMSEGRPVDGIVSATEQTHADLVVMGTHGLSGIQKLVLGSVMEKAIHRVRIPLLALSPETTEGGFEPPATILLAIDFGPESGAVVRHGVWLAERFGAKLIASHVLPIPYIVLNEQSMARLSPEQLDALRESLTSERCEQLRELLPETEVETEVVSPVGSAYQSLRTLVVERSVDLLVMGAGGHREHGLGWIGSTCHKIVRSTRCPVLIAR